MKKSNKPEITPEYLEELNKEYATKLAYKNRQKIIRSIQRNNYV